MDIGAASVLMTALYAGYLIWVRHGEYLLASLVSSIPAWRTIDSLPILREFGGPSVVKGDEDSLPSRARKGSHDATMKWD
jgi:hypothetical protein